jgi:hypothetical protein
MPIQVDQSGKIEDTAKDTVLALSNGQQYALLIPKKVKRQIQELFRQNGRGRQFVINLFSFALYELLKKTAVKSSVIIDLEYPGQDGLISTLVRWWLKEDQRVVDITFSRIGESPRVHYLALSVLKKKRKPEFILTLGYILKKQKDRWALKRMSFNPGRRSKPRSS